jgi:hypothetical protein
MAESHLVGMVSIAGGEPMRACCSEMISYSHQDATHMRQIK